MKKERTPEQIQADKERMARVRQARQAAPSMPEDKVMYAHQLSDEAIQDLLKTVEDLKQKVNAQANTQATPDTGISRGRLVGTFEKYIVDPAYYPDPRERLAAEDRLAQFAFPLNYDLTWTVEPVQYETIDGIRQREPRFKLELRRIVRDEDSGEPTNERYVLSSGSFHEDPQAAIIVARQYNLEVDEANERSFLDEMRYLRFRDWLLEAFYPPKNTQDRIRKRETVIGNRLVEVIEINSHNSEVMPFGDLKKKL